MNKLPSEISAETYVLGAALRSIDMLNKIVDELRVEDFCHLDNARIFSAMVQLYSSDNVANPDTVAAVLKEKNVNIDVFFLYKISSYGVTDEIDYFIEQIKEASHKRHLIQKCRATISLLADKKQSFDQSFFELVEGVELFVSKKDTSERSIQNVLFEHYHESGQTIYEYIQKMQERYAKGEVTLKGSSSGYPQLDQTISGFIPGHFIIVGARPSVGKSTFIINLMYNMLKMGKSCVMFSLEMTAEEVTDVIVAREGRLNVQKILKGQCSAEEYNEILRALERIKEFNMIIDDSSSLNSLQIKSRIKRYIKAYNPDAIFIDYLTLLLPSGKYSSKQEGVQEVSRTLTTIAKQTKIPIICAAQLNRDNEKEKRPPKKSDLRESGQIEQDAHSILLLHRPEVDDPFDSPGMIRVDIAKNRFGPCKKIDFSYVTETAYIKEKSTIKEEHEKAKLYLHNKAEN